MGGVDVFGVFRNPSAGRQGFLLGGVLRAFLVYCNIIKTISVSLQTALAKCVLTARTRLTLDQPPTYPYVAGPLALPDPPSRLYPDHQLPRHDAVPTLSRRPLLFPLRALATAPPPPVHASPVMLSLA